MNEQKVLDILYQLMNREQKDNAITGFIPNMDENRFYADLFAESGIEGLGISGPVVVEIKNRILISTLPPIQHQINLINKNHPTYKFLIIYENLDINLNSEKFSNIIFKSFKQLEKDLNKFNSSSKSSDATYQSDKKEDNRLLEAAIALNNKKVSFILGAGISIDAGGLLWNELLEKLLEINTDLRPIGLSKEDYSIIKEKSGDSLLISGRYILSQLKEKMGEELIEVLQKIFYKRYAKDYPSSPTALQAISKIIRDFDNVESIITFNYDQFIEEALEEAGVKSKTYDKGGILKLGEVPVFHVHGLIARPNDNSNTNIKLLSSRDITLSENDYHEKYLKDNDWSNIELQHALRRHVCFFIGHSMTDPNLRRLLDYAKNEYEKGKEHYVFLKKESFLPKKLEQENKEKKDCKKEQEKNKKNLKLDEMHRQRLENLYEELGINVIWFDDNPDNPNDFSNLPKKIEELHKLALKQREEQNKQKI